VASRPQSGAATLTPLLAESRAQARKRETQVLRRLTAEDSPPLVLFGAGNVGRRLHQALACAGVRPATFADNDPHRWGTCVEETAVLAPADAAARYGAEGIVVVSVFNPDHAFVDTARQLQELGCREVISWTRLAWGLDAPDLLSHFAAGRPSSVLAAADQVERAISLWADPASSDEFVRQIRWRLSGDFAELAAATPDQYFPADLLTLRPDEVFVDCGAFDGDTLRELVRRCPGFERVDAFEPDATNFANLERWAATLGDRSRPRVHLHRAATDRMAGTRRFGGSGTSAAFLESLAEAGLGDAAQTNVRCVSLDDVLADVPVSFIKMDVEGAEADTLHGARGLLRERRPVLALSAYHHPADLWELPLFLAALCEDYRFHLRAHGPDGFETVLYGVPVERSRS
jgi:FkbM family methyltransferase